MRSFGSGPAAAKGPSPVRSAGRRRDPGRAAWDWECRAAGRAGSRNFPWRTAARVAREAKNDQDQAIEIPSFLPRRTGDNRPDQAVGNDFHGRRCLVGNAPEAYAFMFYSRQGGLQICRRRTASHARSCTVGRAPARHRLRDDGGCPDAAGGGARFDLMGEGAGATAALWLAVAHQ
jgi:hypothetical protein